MQNETEEKKLRLILRIMRKDNFVKGCNKHHLKISNYGGIFNALSDGGLLPRLWNK
jgi:hypothetical protein